MQTLGGDGTIGGLGRHYLPTVEDLRTIGDSSLLFERRFKIREEPREAIEGWEDEHEQEDETNGVSIAKGGGEDYSLEAIKTPLAQKLEQKRKRRLGESPLEPPVSRSTDAPVVAVVDHPPSRPSKPPPDQLPERFASSSLLPTVTPQQPKPATKPLAEASAQQHNRSSIFEALVPPSPFVIETIKAPSNAGPGDSYTTAEANFTNVEMFQEGGEEVGREEEQKEQEEEGEGDLISTLKPSRSTKLLADVKRTEEVQRSRSGSSGSGINYYKAAMQAKRKPGKSRIEQQPQQQESVEEDDMIGTVKLAHKQQVDAQEEFRQKRQQSKEKLFDTDDVMNTIAPRKPSSTALMQLPVKHINVVRSNISNNNSKDNAKKGASIENNINGSKPKVLNQNTLTLHRMC